MGTLIVNQYLNSRLLDLYSGAEAAYSLRKLVSTALNVIRVRRSSDDAEADFTANDITSGALTTWVGNNDGFIRTWYDQSVHGRHANQTTTSLQPQIVDNGALVVDNAGKPTLLFEQTKLVAQTLNAVSIFQVLRYKDNLVLYNSMGTRLASNQGFIFDNENDKHRYFAFGSSGFTNVVLTTTSTVRRLYQSILVDGDFRGWANDTQVAGSTATIGYVSESVTPFTIGGKTGSSGGIDMSGEISEIIIYPSDVSAIRPGIESNINNYYNLF